VAAEAGDFAFEQEEADARFEVTAAAENRWIAAEINRSGDFFISQTILRGEFTLRVAVGNLATTQEDMGRLWERIIALSEQAPAHCGG